MEGAPTRGDRSRGQPRQPSQSHPECGEPRPGREDRRLAQHQELLRAWMGLAEGRTDARKLSLVKICKTPVPGVKWGRAILDPSLDDWTLRRTSRKPKKRDRRGEKRPAHGGAPSPEGNVMHPPCTPLRSWGSSEPVCASFVRLQQITSKSSVGVRIKWAIRCVKRT